TGPGRRRTGRDRPRPGRVRTTSGHRTPRRGVRDRLGWGRPTGAPRRRGGRGDVTGRRNLTREQAEQRARLLAVDSYDIRLDLTDGSGGPGVDTFRCTTTVRFRCAQPGESTTIDVAAVAIRSATLNGEPLDTSAWSPAAGLVLPGLAADNELVVDADFAYSSTGQG